MTLTLMCGLSFSGKSTLARGLAEELGAHLVSLDAINHERGLRGGEGIPLDEWATSNGIAHERAGVLLAAGGDVVVDDTGSPRFILGNLDTGVSVQPVPEWFLVLVAAQHPVSRS